MLFGGNLMDSRNLNKRAEKYLTEYKTAQMQLTVAQTEQHGCTTWQPPPSSVYILNFDVAIFSELDRTRVGAIIRND